MATTHAKVDVVTIGAGWTSAILGAKLCPKGRRWSALEQGTHRWTYPDFAHDHDSLRYSVRYAMMVDLARETWTWRPMPRSPALPMRQYGSFNPGEGLGGAAIHWSAQLWRFLETDFSHRSHIVERYGASKLPEGSTIQDWPIDYDDLEPYYDAFEWDLGASGHRRQRPRRDPARRQPVRGSAQSRPTRTRRSPTNRSRTCSARAARSSACTRSRNPPGSPLAPSPILRQPRSGCLYCGFCTRFGCEVDAKASPQNTHLPVALNTGRYHVRLGCKVLRIETGGDGPPPASPTSTAKVRSTSSRPTLSSSLRSRSRTTGCCSSRARQHPDGIGNDRGRVGRNYTYQIYPETIVGLWEGEKLNMYMGNTCTINIVYDYNGDNFDHSDLDFIGGMQLFSEPCEREPFNSVKGLTEGRQIVGRRVEGRSSAATGTATRGSSPRASRSRTRTSSSTSTRTTRTVRQPPATAHLRLARQREADVALHARPRQRS